MAANYDYFSAATLQRYTRRLDRLGACAKALGWGGEHDQSVRFNQALRFIPVGSETSILDIGCGFADFYNSIPSEKKPAKYIGLDVTPGFVEVARQNFRDNASVTIINDDIFNYQCESADYGLMLGLLNYNWGDGAQYDYAYDMIECAFERITKGLVVDFLSIHLDKNYPEEDGVVYYDPSKIVNMVSGLTHRFSLTHDYASIPQREFMIFLQKG